MSEIEPFEFEVVKRDQRFIVADPNKVLRQMKVKDEWQNRAEFGIATSQGIRALLAERTRRADVFARLMEVARDNISHVNQDRAEEMIASDKLDALQSEWDGAQEGRVK